MTGFKQKYGPFALVTGASSGIGVAFAEELAERGLNLVLAARRVDRMEELAQKLEGAHGITVQVIACDLAQVTAPAALLDQTRALEIGLVISNAGFGSKGPHEDNDATNLTDMLMVNSNAPLLLSHGFIPRLRARLEGGQGGQTKRGGLLMVSSVEGNFGGPYSAAYSSSKAMVIALGEALWGELSDTDIDVLTLCPGATESEAAAKQGIDPSKMRNVMPARDVAKLALDHLAEGPTFCPSEHYREMFDGMMKMPRRDALQAMAKAMRPA